VAVVTNYASVNHRALALAVTEAGVPVIDGTEEGLRAIRALFALRDRRGLARTLPPEVPPATVARWRARLTDGPAPGEDEGLAMLAEWGIAVPRRARADTAAAVQAAGAAIGYPLALKSAAPGLQHKSDAGGVVLGIDGPAALAAAYQTMEARLGSAAILAEMVPAGVEIGFGMISDPAFGPVVVAAAGGIWIEALADRATGLAPLTREEAAGMIGGLRIARLLDGGRGRPPADRAALIDALWRFSRLAADLGDRCADPARNSGHHAWTLSFPPANATSPPSAARSATKC
jgi:acyl-CoA synthetase (NDP forming)